MHDFFLSRAGFWVTSFPGHASFLRERTAGEDFGQSVQEQDFERAPDMILADKTHEETHALYYRLLDYQVVVEFAFFFFLFAFSFSFSCAFPLFSPSMLFVRRL